MRQAFLPLLRIALLLTPFVASLGAISAILPRPKPHNFVNIDAASLWTTRPVKVDRNAQQFERLPPRNVRQTAKTSSGGGREIEVISTASESFEAAVDNTLFTGAVPVSEDTTYDNAHMEWCRRRYKSYRTSDNSYQPYNGPRRQCRPQFSAQTDAGDAPLAVEATVYGGDPHGQWCTARYRSYDASDNTYRSYSGQRRPCRSPYF